MSRPWRLFWLVLLASHAATAGAWWWLMPGGFPVSHPRFWSNGVAPLVVLGVVATAVIAARRGRWSLLQAMLVAFPAAWGAAAISCRVVFPITFGRLFLVPILGAALMGAALVRTFAKRSPGLGWSTWPVAVVAAAIGAALPLALRAPAPDTRPVNVAMPDPASGIEAGIGRQRDRLMVHPGDGSLTVKAGAVTLSVNPLLRFFSRSPDGCLTILAPRAFRDSPEPRLISANRDDRGVALAYRADDEASLRVGPDTGSEPIVLEAFARLPRRIDSHLNAFCDIEIYGHHRLSLSFSPCPDRRIEVLPADYPVGRPLRVAYMDDSHGFHVVEATSGEKGPFRELAAGRLDRSEPLSITLYDRDAAIARITLDDWASQAGTALSPTAGWGLPVNAIEFSRDANGLRSTARIFITLAGTSVGRGWDSVGHAPGTYRNRMTIEPLGP